MSEKNLAVSDARRALGIALGRKLLALDVERPDDERFWRPTVSFLVSEERPDKDGLRVSYHRGAAPDVLTDEQAAAYLAWLEAGHIGHYADMVRG